MWLGIVECHSHCSRVCDICPLSFILNPALSSIGHFSFAHRFSLAFAIIRLHFSCICWKECAACWHANVIYTYRRCVSESKSQSYCNSILHLLEILPKGHRLDYATLI